MRVASCSEWGSPLALTVYHKHSPNFYCNAFSVFLTSPVFLPRKQLLLVHSDRNELPVFQNARAVGRRNRISSGIILNWSSTRVQSTELLRPVARRRRCLAGRSGDRPWPGRGAWGAARRLPPVSKVPAARAATAGMPAALSLTLDRQHRALPRLSSHSQTRPACDVRYAPPTHCHHYITDAG